VLPDGGLVAVANLVARLLLAYQDPTCLRPQVGGQARNIVIAQGMRIALAGVGIGVAAALGLTRLMESVLFGVTPRDPRVFIAVAAPLSGGALGGIWLPTRRAARVDPVIALRAEYNGEEQSCSSTRADERTHGTPPLPWRWLRGDSRPCPALSGRLHRRPPRQRLPSSLSKGATAQGRIRFDTGNPPQELRPSQVFVMPTLMDQQTAGIGGAVVMCRKRQRPAFLPAVVNRTA